MSLFEAVENNVRPLTKRDALWLSDQIIDATIDALRRDPDVSPRSFTDWALILGDLRQQIGDLLTVHIDGHVDLDDVLNTIEAMS